MALEPGTLTIRIIMQLRAMSSNVVTMMRPDLCDRPIVRSFTSTCVSTLANSR
jgi:hypothetical protein